MRHGPLTVIAHCPALLPFNLCNPTLCNGLKSFKDSAASRDATNENTKKTIFYCWKKQRLSDSILDNMWV